MFWIKVYVNENANDVDLTVLWNHVFVEICKYMIVRWAY